MTGKDKIIGGVILLLFGIGGIVYGLGVYNNQNKNIQDCNTLSGSPNQLNSNDRSLCIHQSGISILAAIPGIIGVIMLIIGIILIAFGIKNKKVNK